MSRANRVMDLLDLLRASELVTVADLAARLECSRRTVLRDLATLRERGWPIRSDTGPGGGVFLDRDRGVTAIHLSADELASLWLAARLSASMSPMPWFGAARSALDKILASVPLERQRRLRRIVRRVVVGRPATARVVAGLGRPSANLMPAFERAVADNLCLAFAYVDSRGNRTQRCVEPHGLLVEPPAWYLLTRDTRSNQPRMFRMDRIRSARVVADRPFEPDFESLRAQHEAFGAKR